MSRNNKYLVTDIEGLVKDPTSGAVLSVDNVGLEAYRKQKAAFESSRSSVEKIAKLENDINDIKQMLQQILKR